MNFIISTDKKLRGRFRLLIVSDVILSVSTFALGCLQMPFLPPLLHQYVCSEHVSKTIDYLGLVSISLQIVSWIGLWKDWQIARRLYVISTGVTLFVISLYPPGVHLSVSIVINDISCIIPGVIIGMLFFSDLRHHYERKKTSQIDLGANPL